MIDHKNQAVKSLKALLEAVGIPCNAAQDCVLFERWPTLAFRILDVNIDQPSTNGFIVHMNVRSELNMQRPDTFITSCCTGVGTDIDEAILDGVDVWCKAESSVVFSLLNQSPVMETEWCPNGDPLGVPGWDCFLGPYVIRVWRQADQDMLSTFIREYPLLEPVRLQLGDYLDRQSLFHSISIFWGVVSGKHFADCHIDGVDIPILGETLLSAPWPSESINFGTVRQSLLLLNPGEVR